jgi:hypothetical protein
MAVGIGIDDHDIPEPSNRYLDDLVVEAVFETHTVTGCRIQDSRSILHPVT